MYFPASVKYVIEIIFFYHHRFFSRYDEYEACRILDGCVYLCIIKMTCISLKLAVCVSQWSLLGWPNDLSIIISKPSKWKSQNKILAWCRPKRKPERCKNSVVLSSAYSLFSATVSWQQLEARVAFCHQFSALTQMFHRCFSTVISISIRTVTGDELNIKKLYK